MNLMPNIAMGMGHGRYPSIIIDTSEGYIPVDGKAMELMLPKFANDAKRRGLHMDVFQMTDRVQRSQRGADPESLLYAIITVVDMLSKRLGVEASKVSLLNQLQDSMQIDIQRMPTYSRGVSRFPQCLTLFNSLASVAHYSRSQPMSSILSTFFLQKGAIIARRENPKNIIRWWLAIRKLYLEQEDKAMCFREILKGKPSIMTHARRRLARDQRLLNEFLGDMVNAANLRPGFPRRGILPPPRVSPPPPRMGFQPGFFDGFRGFPGPMNEDDGPLTPGWFEEYDDEFPDMMDDEFVPRGMDGSLEDRVASLEVQINGLNQLIMAYLSALSVFPRRFPTAAASFSFEQSILEPNM
ncbi:hypothetical protein BU16DRAFT_554484 [Lophium mytilinum]|uniref:Uncharacterized protein n=1 Tax=Lophium mytilinum TaxID=390894 RepID=A0A6A6RC42_9PEZI|nr:hypothetical protein BU16DRAFT_554484 [Lophium mytilinum]